MDMRQAMRHVVEALEATQKNIVVGLHIVTGITCGDGGVI